MNTPSRRPDRRAVVGGLAAATAAGAGLPRFAIGQTDDRPVITVAVQKIANSNTLEIGYEASNVGTRHYLSYKEPLIGTDWTGNLALRPGLAESWQRVDDRTIELGLRRGVRFHNGDELTAEDVVFSFGQERLFGVPERQATGANHPKQLPAALVAGAASSFPSFERMEIVDRHTVRYVNRQPDVTLEGRLSLRVGTIISRRAFMEAPTWLAYARKPVGTGPYQVREFRADTSLILDAFDGYWGERPPVKTIRFLEVPEVASRINGLFSGEYDFACDIPPDQIATIEGNPRYEVQGGLITNQRILAFDKTHPQLVDPRVRRALTHAIDRQAIVDTLWGGRTKVSSGMQFEFFDRMFIENWAPPAFDLAEARRLLREAGYKGDPIPYRLLNNYYTNQTATGQILTEMWRTAGINVELSMKENWGQIGSRDTPRGIRDWSTTAFFNDPVSNFPANFGANGSMPRNKEWENAEVNEAIRVLETSTDWDRRKQAFRRMLEILEREDPAVTVLHHTANFTAKRRDIRWKSAQSFVMDFSARNFAIGRS